MIKSNILLSLFAVAIFVPVASASTLYTDRAAFEAASSGLTNIDFEGIAAPGGFTDQAAGLSIGNATFTGSDNYLFVVDSAYDPFYQWGSGAVLLGNDKGTITLNFGTAVTAVGSDIMSILNGASDMNVQLSTGESFAVSTSANPTRAFVGFTSDTAITSMTITGVSGYPIMDNVAYGSAVPEPATMAALAAGLFGLARRRNKKA